MAGVVAMASIIEDFDKQPCKKSRKDVGSPVVKSITNYFPPVAKPVEKPFSPPRSNNIMDYFSRKPSSSKEKSSTPEQSKENCQRFQSAEKPANSEQKKPASQRRGRKSSKAARKLVAAEPADSTEDVSCVIIEATCESKGVLESSTSPPLAQVCAESKRKSAEESSIDKQEEKEEHFSSGSVCTTHVEDSSSLKAMELSPIAKLGNEEKRVGRAALNAKKRHQQETKSSDTEVEEMESSMCDVSMEVNLDEASQLNNSTVTISFEEFVRSQSEEKTDEDGISTANKIESQQSAVSQAEVNVGSGEPSVQVSPRTLTIQADVHVSPKQESAKAAGKLASIFNRRKKSLTEAIASPQSDAGQQPPPLAVKRKSNVVLEENDLELTEFEGESSSKCSVAERKQFMAAFKQPSLDGSKTKPVKSQLKQKQPEETTLAAEDDTVVPPSVEESSPALKENTAAKVKSSRKGKKKAKKGTKSVDAPTAEAATVEQTAETVDDKKEEPATPSSVPAVRRSRRETAAKKTPEANQEPTARTTRKQKQSEADAAVPQDSSETTSTPKTRRSRRGVFVAEMVCPPDAEESPIRIKFTRVQKNVSKSKAESGNDKNITKTSDESKKRKQAKKLVAKAKVMQSKKTSVEEQSTLRRSGRTEASVRRSYVENEDSIICIEADQPTTPPKASQKSKNQKPLRSLNDVLIRGSKGAEKTSRKVPAVISIFDDSSQEGSENSQDDEQFRARREFLKSGLPESFKKQIAKTAATKEAYSVSCSSFQAVTHTTQPPNDCPLWSLSWPESPLLCRLRELWNRTSNPPQSVGGSLCVKTLPAERNVSERVSGCRPEISDGARQLLLEELITSNPQFPAQTFMTRLLKRQADYKLQYKTSESEAETGAKNTSLPTEPVSGKRKRRDDEEEKTVKVSKKQRSVHLEETTAAAEPAKRGGRTRRTQRARLEEEEEEAKPSPVSAPIANEEDSVVIVDDLILGADAGKKDAVKEDVLWTDKYQPQHSSDIIDNTGSVKRLHSWLKEWKIRADREERKKQKDKKQGEDSGDSDWECEGEDMLCNTMIITGPTGVGKTAAVYACAQELGFKVFEVNASSQRSGRLILSQLKEATQSHQVDSQGVGAHKPSYFNSYSTSSTSGSIRPGTSPRKINSPRRVVSSPRKHPQSPKGTKRGGLAPTSLATYFFKMGQPTNKEARNTTKNEQTAAPKKVTKAPKINAAAASAKVSNSEEQTKKTATSLILFEEVDVIFEEDSGFLAAIKTFMTTTKRPVVLTTSDSSFSTMFDGYFEEIHFKTPSELNVTSYLQLLCLAEDTRTDPSDVTSLLRLNGSDIRQSLLQMQFWSCSAGGDQSSTSLVQTNKKAELKADEKEAPSTLPSLNSDCTESKLGLLNIQQKRNIWELLKSQSLADDERCWELLTNIKRRGVDLLYSNMEQLLPLPLTQLSASIRKPEQPEPVSTECPAEQQLPDSLESEKTPSHTTLLQKAESMDCSDESSPIKVSNRMRTKKKRHRAPGQDGLHSDSDSEEGFLSLGKLHGPQRVKEEVGESLLLEKPKRKPLTPEERAKSVFVSQCLESMADFLDNMSYTDSALSFHPAGGNGHRKPPVTVVIKDGMTDELREEANRGNCGTEDCVLEIQSAVEALSFCKCRASVAEAWDRAQKLEGETGKQAAAELSLPLPAHRSGYSFIQDGPCQPQLEQQRREVMETLAFRVSGSPFNRAAAALDYLPIVRSICRSEQLKEQGKVKRRFLHYLDVIHSGLDKSMLRQLAEDFP